MTRKRKGNNKTRTPRIRPLEHLLKTAEPEDYGQLCWSLANRDTKRRQVGEVVKLGGRDRNGSWIEKRFRLTEDSIANISRCLGIRTCGEASALFTEPDDSEPWGECPSGHQEAAFQYLMYGIMPTKPCAECGEIPTFQGLAMSLDLKSNGPVKGTDGIEYSVCPRCGDDVLELQGNSPVKWGWDIVCINCGGQIKQAEELDIHQYSDLMEEIKLKVEAIQRLMEMPGIINQTRVESVCLQLRMVLELVIFSSLVSNKDAWRKSQEELRKAWNVKKIMSDLRGIHGKYYPEPKGKIETFLTEDRLINVYDQLNKVIHAENPLGTEVNLRHYIESVPKWLELITSLLTEHKVFLYHHSNVFYWVRMFGGPEGDVLCTPVRANSDGKGICSWPDCVQQGNRQLCEYIGQPWQECQLMALERAQIEAKRISEAYDQLRTSTSRPGTT